MEFRQSSSIRILPTSGDNVTDQQIDFEGQIQLVALPVKQVRDKPVSYFVFGYFAYVLALLPVTYLLTYIDEINTGSELFAKIYERNTFYTSYFSPMKLILWMGLAIVGFTFVGVVNLQNERRNPFMSRDGSYKDIKKLIPIAFVIYFVAAIVLLRDKYDMRRGCPVINSEFLNQAEELGYIKHRSKRYSDFESYYEPVTSFTGKKDWSNLFESVAEDVSPLEHCHTFTRSEVFWYNYWYIIMYFIGLNFTHLDNPPFNQLTLEWDVMKKWPWYMWVIFVAIMGFIFVNFLYLLSLYYQSGVIGFYLLLLLAMPVFFIGGSYVYRNTRKLHVHHYVIGCCMVIMTGYQSTYVSTLGAVFMGIMVEGSCRWGFDPIWVPK